MEADSSLDQKNDIIKIKRPGKRKKSFLKIAGVVLLLMVISGFFYGARVFSALRQISVKNESGSSPFFKFSQINPNALSGEGDGRINILLIGIGGAKHKSGGNLADSIIVASIDSQNKSMALLSIPRDLLVTLPKPLSGKDKINAVHSLGEQKISLIPGGGPVLLKTTVSQVLDLPIHYFIRIDFDGFKDIIDKLGGIDVFVEKAIYDSYYPATNLVDYDPFKISEGKQHLDGKTALKYARSRETTSDFDRARRQQQVLGSIKDKSLTIGVLSNPKKILDIFGLVGQHIRTDMQTRELERLISIIKDIPQDKIVNKVLDNGPDGPLKSFSDNGYYLTPKSGDFNEIQRIAHEIFTDPYLNEEKAKIVVYNGSSKSGQGQEVSTMLKSYNYNIVKTDKLPSTFNKTTIYDLSDGKKKFTLNLIKKRLHATIGSEIPAEFESDSGADIIVVIGEDYSASKKSKD